MIQRVSIVIRGAVQGVGFRPFIYRLATELQLKGFVLNSPTGVFIEAESEKEILNTFLLRIEKEKPIHAIIQSMEFSFLDVVGYTQFEICDSETNGKTSAFILPDIAVCDDCLKEMFDPNDRRYLYPFINCTNCGPRFSIIESLPYDRPGTSMKIFEMCDDCKQEYDNPLDRRFHAQPIACPKCGPHIELITHSGKILSRNNNTILATADKIRQGKIVALKGLGGYQLICRADDENIIAELRKRKNREGKPFALMFPDLESIKEVCEVFPFEERLLKSPESPIVLLKRKEEGNQILVHSSIAPGNPTLGVMLPYTPLHHLLLKELQIPIIATSGNLSEEPMCITEEEAFQRLKNIADYFLIHNRPIVRHVDDSIVRVMMDREIVMRRARGYAPLPVELNCETENETYLAVGGHLKNTVALSSGKNVFVSQHIGDLSTQEAFSAFQNVVNDFKNLYEAKDILAVADLHPDYLSTKFAKNNFENISFVQHHQAHVASCYAENKLEGTALGVSWDGTGYGLDGTIWGGEFFRFDDSSFMHFAQFRKFPLPGGDLAIKEPGRSAVGLLFEIFGEKLFEEKIEFINIFSEQEKKILLQMLKNKINSPLTSSVGRLFDAVAFLTGFKRTTSYEGEAAMMLEFAAAPAISDYYPFDLLPGEVLIIDWQKMIETILDEMKNNVSPKIISAKFHNTLVESICSVAEKSHEEKIVLSGGVFQNAYLLEHTVHRLRTSGFNPYWHQRIPTNDGGISLGQVAIAMNQKKLGLGIGVKEISIK
ncbi:MAG: carbamoyltransferase HypF [Ignavibacteria bacterium CG22_combo_CG10-13_8_21_14_all_37_15]|nr:carbamoyltransferase HypF [Ignavibacteria bacterium]OIO13535.1 MAG: carbamoyltransferase HypF [Ignavibacteria bacterium CG1_02_37_35]PIP78137.1 MAG: carbamoyltransferase HypF [Ignavibacteria bacterium CG22_combo_CG10-13_8_21_14_all_37_15]PIS44983.1 MAG: carbamoyltransferase HypF [Ignavibacteria bacterium CG08_land_8_20_14_0_20_37_9]PIX92909.1 MAG: carbamoyltransferase HypF [Ignavibacteria bacterium CG_4_10_14_3_um_filter_37_18]PJC57063.1 MAG: carbamoyltransferase HypF [Ignavibacteria bacter